MSVDDEFYQQAVHCIQLNKGHQTTYIILNDSSDLYRQSTVNL